MGYREVSDALKTKLQTISAIKQVFGCHELPDSINEAVTALIVPTDTSYHGSHDDIFQPAFRIILMLTRQDLPAALSRLLPLMEPTGDNSVKAVLESDRSLGGVIDDIQVLGNNGFSNTTWGGANYLSTEFAIKIIV